MKVPVFNYASLCASAYLARRSIISESLKAGVLPLFQYISRVNSNRQSSIAFQRLILLIFRLAMGLGLGNLQKAIDDCLFTV